MNTDTEILNKLNQAIQHYIDKIKEKNYTVISKNAEKAFDKMQHPFIITIIKNTSN